MRINCIVCDQIHDIDMARKVWDIDYGDLCCGAGNTTIQSNASTAK